MKHYMQVDPQTGLRAYYSVSDDTKLPIDAWEVESIPTGEFEAHDPHTGKIVCDEAAKADHDAGPKAISAAHAIKAIEARLILAGLPINGMILAEAELLGVSTLSLAEAICAKSEPLYEGELTRIAIKNGITAANQKE